jgi:hypothetical protein
MAGTEFNPEQDSGRVQKEGSGFETLAAPYSSSREKLKEQHRQNSSPRGSSDLEFAVNSLIKLEERKQELLDQPSLSERDSEELILLDQTINGMAELTNRLLSIDDRLFKPPGV